MKSALPGLKEYPKKARFWEENMEIILFTLSFLL